MRPAGINVHRNRGRCIHGRRRRSRVAMHVEALLVVAVTAEARRIPAVAVEAHHVVASLVVALRIEASAVVTLCIVAEGVEARAGVALLVVAVVVEASGVESENVVAVDVETGRVVDILRGARLAALVDVLDSITLVGPPGLHGVVSDTVDGEAVEVRLGDKGLHRGEVGSEIDRLAARQLVLTALKGLDTEDTLHSAVLRRQEAVEVYGEVEGCEHESLFGCERRSSDESHLLFSSGNFLGGGC